MIASKFRQHSILVLLIAFFAATNIVWIFLDQSPPWWDMASHSSRSLEYFRALQKGDLNFIIHDPEPHPPLQYFLTAPFFALFGINENIPQLSLLPSLILLCVSVYFATLEISRKKDAALLAVFLVMTYPLFTHFSRIYFLDFTLATLVTFSIFALLKTDSFRRLNWSLITGIALGAGLLTKWSMAVFFTGPAIYLLIQTLREKSITRSIRKKQVVHIACILLIAAIISLPWYSLHLEVIKKLSRDTQQAFQYLYDIKQQRPWGFTNMSFYLLGNHALAWVISWPLLFLFFVSLARYPKKTRGLFLLSWFLVPYLFFSLLIPTKEIRHILPLIPVIAAITAITLVSHKKIVIATGLFASLLWLETSWGVRLIGRSLEIFSNLPKTAAWLEIYGYPVQQEQNTHVVYGASRPTSYNTEIQKVVKKIQEDKQKNGTEDATSSIAVVPNYQYLTGSNVKWYGEITGLKADYDVSRTLKYPGVRPIDVIEKIDYLIMKEGYQGPTDWNKYAPALWLEEENNPDSKVFSKLELIGQWSITTPEDTKPVSIKLYGKR